jgi:hypothetical protein
VTEKFGGKVPQTMEEILTWPGVARKTGNVVLGRGTGLRSGRGYACDAVVAEAGVDQGDRSGKKWMTIIPQDR